jgi:predicted outer membrane lipoprotein
VILAAAFGIIEAGAAKAMLLISHFK